MLSQGVIPRSCQLTGQNQPTSIGDEKKDAGPKAASEWMGDGRAIHWSPAVV
jgi:hypothetical protein